MIENKKDYHLLILFIIAVSIIKLVMVANLPIYAISSAMVDDRLMINTTSSLLSLNWLGDYNECTLVKGMFFPLILGIFSYCGISYTIGISTLYIIASILFIIVIKDKIKNKFALFFIYLILLFNPITYGVDTFQRVYRNSITPAQVLFVISCFIALYYKNGNIKYKKSIWIWTIGAGISLATFWNTREDSIWILPFIIVITILCFIKIYIQNKNEKNYKNLILKGFITIIPLIILIFTNNLISFINYKNYGIYTTNELNNSNFTKALKSIYSVKQNENIDYVTVTREKLNRIYQFSPTMNELRNYIEAGLNAYMGFDNNPYDNEIEDGIFFWGFRLGISMAGYYEKGSQAVNELYLKIHQEIEKAIEDGNLERQNIMPSALMSPWRADYNNKLMIALKKSINYVYNYEGITTSVIESVDDYNGGIYLFESITNNKAIHPNKEYQENEIKIANRYSRRLNKITNIYKKTGKTFFILGIIGYVCIIIKTIIDLFKKQYKELDILILLTGMLGSFLVLAIGVSYSDISAFSSINSLYLSGGYPLVIAFETISICKLIQLIIMNGVKKWKKKN